MAPNIVSLKDNSQEDGVVIRELQALLSKSLGSKVQILEYTTRSLVPNGENYGSTILRLDATIKKHADSEPQELQLVAKMIPSTEYQQNVWNTSVSFAKEIFVFEELFSVYREIEEQAGIEQPIDAWPRYYGGRLSLKSDSCDVVDADAVILMGNLLERGYYVGSRMKGLDLEHTRLAVSELARFHAMGVAAAQTRQGFLERNLEKLDRVAFGMSDSDFESLVESTLRSTCMDPRIAKYEERLRASLSKTRCIKPGEVDLNVPWLTIIHGDLWVNNVMFRKEENKVVDVKFLDFQIARLDSATRDLPCFLCCSISPDLFDKHFDDLLDLYYESFIASLARVGGNLESYSRRSFDAQMDKDGHAELFHCLLAMKFCTLENGDSLDLADINSKIFHGDGSNAYLERAWTIVSKYIEKGWL